MQDEIIINKYIRIFQECLNEELTLVEEQHKPAVIEMCSEWTTRTLLYSFGDPRELSNMISKIFTAAELREFVYGLSMRFIVKISGNEDISLNKLINIVTAWCLTSEAVETANEVRGTKWSVEDYVREMVLIPADVPMSVRETLLGVSTNIPLTLDANRFLIVPIMLHIGGLVDAPIAEKSGSR